MPVNKPLVDRFFVLDFDRTLGNTNKIYILFQRIVESIIDNDAVRQLENARQRVEGRGGSFDSITYVQDILIKGNKMDSWQLIVDQFMIQAKDDAYLEPGARRLLEYLDTHGYPYGIVTYGGVQWQQLKIQAVGLDAIPAVVTDTQKKRSFDEYMATTRWVVRCSKRTKSRWFTYPCVFTCAHR